MHICAAQEKLYSPSSSGPSPLSGGEAVHNDLSCQCSGTVCICGAPLTGHSLGGPDAGNPKDECEGEEFASQNDQEGHEKNKSTDVQWVPTTRATCNRSHYLCTFCLKLDYCSVDGPEVR